MTSSNTVPALRYGFVGCGMMGQEHLRNLALLPGSVVSAIFEPDDDMWRASAALVPGAERVDSLDALVDRRDVDALVITSPNHCHAAQLQAIFARRDLPVLLEKPACTEPDDLLRLAELDARVRGPIWVAMEYRYMPPIAAFRARWASGELGPVHLLHIREHRFPFLPKVGDWNRFNRNSGGTLVEKCCHFFDLMRLLAGSEPTRVYASGGQAVNHLDERYAGERPDIADHALAIVDFDNGLRAGLELSMFAEGSRYQEELSAVGERAKLECKVPGPGRFWSQTAGAPPVPQLIVSPRDGVPEQCDVPVDPALLAAGDHNGSTFYQHQRFRAAVLYGAAVEVSLRDGLRAVQLGMAAQRSMASGEAEVVAALGSL